MFYSSKIEREEKVIKITNGILDAIEKFFPKNTNSFTLEKSKVVSNLDITEKHISDSYWLWLKDIYRAIGWNLSIGNTEIKFKKI